MQKMPRTKEYSPRLRHRMKTQHVFYTWYAHLYAPQCTHPLFPAQYHTYSPCHIQFQFT